MEYSHLWYKICIRERLDSLSLHQLHQIVCFIKNELDCSVSNDFSDHVTSVKQMTSTFLFNKNTEPLTTRCLADLWHYVAALKISVNNSNDSASQSHVTRPTSTRHINDDDHDKFKSSSKKQVNSFSLIKLPIDLISHTSLFLCENSIIQFERCCRCLYQVTNSLTFITKSNNFKGMCLALCGTVASHKKILSMKYIAEHPFDFFKFCKLTKLEIVSGEFEQLRNDFEKILNQDWFVMCLNSMRKLWLGWCGSCLIDMFPWSHLSKLEYFQLHLNRDKAWKYFSYHDHANNNDNDNDNNNKTKKQIPVEKFELSYMDNIFDNPNLWIIKDDDKDGDDDYSSKPGINLIELFDLNHLELSELQIDIKYFEKLAKQMHLTSLTFDGDLRIYGINSYNYHDKQRLSLDIITLRLTDIREAIEIGNHSIVGNQQALELLNLDKSVKNLTLRFNIDCSKWFDAHNTYRNACSKFIVNVLKKYYFCNLKNLNILVEDCYDTEVVGAMEESQSFFCKEFFDILLTNKQYLKNQFKQFNIAIKNSHIDNIFKSVYHVFSWNNKMTQDEILLHKDKFRKVADYFLGVNIDDPLDQDLIEGKNKYCEMEQQWDQKF